MRVEKDNKLYEEFHEKVARELVETIYSQISEIEGIDPDIVESITSNLAFSVGTIIDGSRVMDNEGRQVLPYLAFSESAKERKNLIVSDTGSYIHEMIFGLLDDMDLE